MSGDVSARLAIARLYAQVRQAQRYLPQDQHRAVVTLLDLVGEWLRTGDASALLIAQLVEARLARRHPPQDLRPGQCWALAARCLLWAARGYGKRAIETYLTSAERMLLRADGLQGQA